MGEQRYPVNVRLIGVLQKEKSKMYITSVIWSDQNDIIVYRTLKDFKTLHKQMKKTFPPANPLKKSDRIIPIFRDWKAKKGKSLVQLKYLEKYCSKLLRCDPSVSQCSVLIQFFHPKDQDIQPDIAKNSIVIMPSEDYSRTDNNSNVGNITQPFLTQTYQCVAPYETKDTKNRPFKVAMNEHIDVLIKDKAGWWLVENEDKCIAWFPAPYLVKIDENEDEMEGLHGESVLYCAAKRYSASNADEVSVEIGSVVEILQKSDHGWWLVRYKGQTGYIPAMYLQPYNNPRLRLEALQQDLCSSSLNLSQLQVPGSRYSLGRHSVDLCHSQLQVPGSRYSLGRHSVDLCHSHGNLLLPPGPEPPTLSQKSRSLNALSVPRPPPVIVTPPAPAYPARGDPETDGEAERGERSPSGGSESSAGSDPDLSSTSCSSSVNLRSAELLRQGQVANRTHPGGHVSEGRMVHSRSENNLFKVPPSMPKVPPSMPKVPPRPRPQEILTRCTTVTRGKASSAGLHPQPAVGERY